MSEACDSGSQRKGLRAAVARHLEVEMRDGIHLATDVYRPVGVDGQELGPSPTLLLRTPYSRLRMGPEYAEWFTEHGYSVVLQDVRGTFDSEGDFDFLVHEAEDGADTLAWIDEQSWSNGRVGTWGNSYSSFTQLAAATQGPRNLRSMVPSQSASRAWESSVRHGGAFELRWLTWALWHSVLNGQRGLFETPEIRAAISRAEPSIRDWLQRQVIRPEETHLREVPSYLGWLERLMSATGDEEFWRSPAFAPADHVHAMPPCSVLLIGGWYDSYARGTIELYEALSANADLDVHLMMGPWVHGGESPESSFAGDVDLGPRAAVRDLREFHLRWFDRTLRDTCDVAGSVDADLDPGRGDRVKFFVMGRGSGAPTSAGRLHHGGHWVSTTSWSQRGVEPQDWYLHPRGVLARSVPDIDQSSTTYAYDPDHPVPSIGGNVSSLDELEPLSDGFTTHDAAGGTKRLRHILTPGGFDQTETPAILGARPPHLPLAVRSDVLVFRSEPLADDLELLGAAIVTLHVASSAVDTDFTAKLIDEYPRSRNLPSGYALNLSDSIVRLRYRRGGHDDFIEPDQVVEVRIELYPTANIFAKGHRIRLDVSSSNYPRFDTNPNTGDPQTASRRRTIAANTVHHSRAYASRVEIPVRIATS
jgi:uncharacterized protein